MSKGVRYQLGVVALLLLLAISSFMLGRTSRAESGSGGIVFSCDPQVLQTLAIPKKPATVVAKAAISSVGTGQYFASKNGERFYPARCGSAQKRIKPENLIWFQTQEEAALQGFTPGNSC